MTVLAPDMPQVELAVVELTNAFRAENRLSSVALNATLTRAARAYAEFLAKSDLFSHTADGRQPADRVKAAGYKFCQVAENLALNLDSRGFETRQLARDAVEGWKNSPGHRRNMLTEHVTEIGVGLAKARGQEKYISVQLFGRPESLRFEFQINNISAVTVSYAHAGERQTLEPGYAVRHTACIPGALEFAEAGSGAAARPIQARYEARDGDVFVVKGKRASDVRVELKREEKAAPAASRERAAVTR
jgi:hypothetical protein